MKADSTKRPTRWIRGRQCSKLVLLDSWSEWTNKEGMEMDSGPAHPLNVTQENSSRQRPRRYAATEDVLQAEQEKESIPGEMGTEEQIQHQTMPTAENCQEKRTN